ncbi:hypothetical protein GGR28_003063 [Lewinella aquimaris]|uniref:Uncharacterized protein n=1 Tax=Neolewinella aquimaris TaxID=1835722 RepID=A0A840EF51_9BACT|nr:hypothetical protein [Neolewinella aquimaris]MBB4080429.1 hypothetical protein [Neolewinella aquimaris]
MNNYENYFEEIENRAQQIGELIEEIIKLDDIIATHQQYDSQGLQKDQYVKRREEYTARLNQFLHPHKLKIVSNEAA